MDLSSRAYRIETVWEGLRLVIEEHPDGGDWLLFVYDEENCEVLYPPMLAYDVDNEPTAISSLDVPNIEARQFGAAQPRTDEKSDRRAVTDALNRGQIRNGHELLRLFRREPLA